ncbi:MULTISPECIES: hypothetical protein [Streptomyces]|uniref:Uncharacterized protein n=2 Tax=Streptomyces TaxID=1883 RepID=A0A100Y7V1_9ACTN|nr:MULTISPECIES: hypothetical protein [Streptomyces]KUH39272.1 hypothetical protein ATE80_08390 [Streptomyces kanasensis]UUS32721.1 hypothetical protein NRO40_19140 [Streptomyces changanensis]
MTGAGLPLVRPCLAVEPSDRPRPADVLDRFLAELRRLPTPRGGSRRLPPRWTEPIATYERRGEEWRRALPAGPGTPPAADDRAAPVPPPGPTRADTGQRERERERQRAEAQQREAEQERARQREAEPGRPRRPRERRRPVRVLGGGRRARRGLRAGAVRPRRQPRTARASISTRSPVGRPT